MKKALHLVKNKYTKYIITGTAFVVWMAYFDRNDWLTQAQRKQELENTQAYISQLRAEIADMKKQRDGIQNDPAVLEKFAREHYRLKKDNEDVYVFD